MISIKDKRLFAGLVKRNKNFLISGHQNPDGDVIGSTLALALGLKQFGKKVVAYNQDGCPASLKFLPKSTSVVRAIPKKFTGVLITVDSGNRERLGPALNEFPFLEIWNIDHHQSNTRFGTYNFIDVKAGSTGQVVMDLLDGFKNFKLTPDIAQAIFCTLSTDTGSFKYQNSTPQVFRLAARVVEAGAKPQKISQALYDTYPARKLALLSRVLPSLKFEKQGQVAKLFMSHQDVVETTAAEDDAEDFVNLPRGVEGVKIVCFFREMSEHHWRLSLRARGTGEVLSIAQAFGGGGHKSAAGCVIEGTRQEVEAQLDQVLNGVKSSHESVERRSSR